MGLSDMKTDAVTAADLARSVIAVPPLARAANGAVSIAENQKILDWMASGGVAAFLYGGNANFYNLSLLEYPVGAAARALHEDNARHPRRAAA
jgi:hypothetical protein